ncbi:MAG: hypothetical protein BroJett011_62160 [Chloroflexota bacterium]|nr:MAG: hypothetical protein BroJett011_62160 [Chloroflexota bacterium]
MEPCPHCGHPLAIVPARPTYHGWSQPATFQNAVQTPLEPAPLAPTYSNYERRQPARPATWESDVLVPLAQSAVWGLIGGLLSIGLPAFVNGWPWWTPGPAFILSTSLAWWLISADHQRALWIVEKIINRDFDGDGQAGAPEPEPITLEIIHKTESGSVKHMLRFQLPEGISQDDFYQFSRGITLEKRSLAESTWTGRGKLFSKGEYSRLLDDLTKAEVIRWRNKAAPAQGRELTKAGYLSFLAYVNARTHTHASDDVSNYEFIEGVG